VWSGDARSNAQRELVWSEPSFEPILITADLYPLDTDWVAAMLDEGAAGMVSVVDMPLDEERKSLSEGGVERNEMPGELDTVGTGATHRQRRATGSLGDGFYVVCAQTQHCGPLADLDESLFHPRPEGTAQGLVVIDDRHQLDVVAAQRNDSITGAMTRMTPARDGCETELVVEPACRRVEIVNRDNHVIDSQHAPTLCGMDHDLRAR
jgi:hypothetical protein